MGEASRRQLTDLGIWQRFHVKLTLVFGVVALLALGLMAAAYYVTSVRVAMTGLRERLTATTVTMARMLRAEDLTQLRVAGDAQGPVYQRLVADLKAISDVEQDLLSIYVLVPTEVPGKLRFALDFATPKARSAAAAIGDEYDATKNATLQAGLKAPTVDADVVRDAWGDSLSAYAPVLDAQGKTVALVGADADAAAIAQTKHGILVTALLLALLAAGVLGTTGIIVGRNLRGPIHKLIEGASAISTGNFDTRLDFARDDEFGILGQHFDGMANGLQERDRIRATFGRYVSEDVAKRVLSGSDGARMGGEEREVTVLFSDLRGYSTISEMLSPTETVAFLNEYLEVMNAEIDKEGGCIIEFLGDAILAVFGAPNDLPDHPARAMRCAVAMREGLARFNTRMRDEGRAPWLAKGMAELGQRIGVHTGQVVAGNLGSKVRVKYAVIGDAVNVASRTEGLNKLLETEILCTAATWARLPEAQRAGLIDKGAHDVKGRAGKVEVYAA